MNALMKSCMNSSMTPGMKSYLRAEMNSRIKSYMKAERNTRMTPHMNHSMKYIFGYGFLMCCLYGIYLYNMYTSQVRMNAHYKKFKDEIDHSDLQMAELGLGKE